MYYCSAVVGLMPFKINSNGVENSVFAIVWCTIFTTVCGTISFIVRTNLKLQAENGLVLEITDFLQLWLGLINLVITALINCTYKNKVEH